MMVAAVSGAASTTDPQNAKTTTENSKRPPLLPSEKNNERKPKSRVVSSRYMTPSTPTPTPNSSSVSSFSSSSRRFPYPLISRKSAPVSNAPSLGANRSVSVDQRRPAATRPFIPDLDSKHNNASEISAATKLLMTSTRSLSVSFQGETFSLPISKTKVAPPSPNLSSVRTGTPERRSSSSPFRGKVDGGGDQVGNLKLSDHHRWPSQNRMVNPRSLDCRGRGGEKLKLVGSGNAIRTLNQLMRDERRSSIYGRLSLDLISPELLKSVPRAPHANSVNNELSVPSDLTASDSDSISSDSTSGVQEFGGASHGRNGPRGIVVSARFWQEANSRLRRLQDPGSPISTSPGSKLIVPPNLKRYSSDGPTSSPRTMSSPARGGIRPPSPGKLMTPIGSSPSRGHSLSRIRNSVSTIKNSFIETPSILSFSVDVWRGKVGESQIVDAHLLRLLYNRNLQWRFVNARAEAVLLVQKHSAEKNLWNAWIAISDLRDAVTKKRHRLQLLKQKLKLASILKGQMNLFEDWTSLEKDHSISLLEAIEALKTRTLCLPVVGATINVLRLKGAIGSAVDVMQGVASSICSLHPVVEDVNSLVTELAKVTVKERALLEKCTDFTSLLAALQIQENIRRTHIIRLNCV